MIYLSVVSLTAALLYCYVGVHAIRANRKSRLCRIFFVLNLSMATWSLGDAFMYISRNPYESNFWNNVAAFGWCTFEALILYFVLVLIENKQIRHWYVKLFVMLPAIVLLFMVLSLFGPDKNTPQSLYTFFYMIDFIYYFTYLTFSILLIFLWGYRSDNKIRKKQAFIISISSIMPLFLNLVIQNVLPALHIVKPPYIGQLYSLIMLLGVYYAITKYQFMSIPSSQVTNGLFDELTGLTILTDSQGVVIRVNKQASTLLECSEDEMIGKSISEIFHHPDIDRLTGQLGELKDRMKLKDLEICSRTGNILPLHLTIIPLFIDKRLVGGILLIGEDLRATIRLKQNNECILQLNKDLMLMNIDLMNKSIKDGLTNLYNHQHINERLEEILKKITTEHENLCLMMLDIDHFKRVNDRYGHLVGDMVLQTISDLIMNNISEKDLAGRYGGEEFIVILSGTDLDSAYQTAENIRLAVCNYDYGVEDMKVSISIGLAKYQGETLGALINKADILLYQAKTAGRNRVELSPLED